MSHKAFTWAAEQRAGGPGPKAVLLVLADRADENHSCYPGQDLIAYETEQSVRTVRRQLKDLEDRGLIIRERREDVRGHRTSDRYILPVNVTVRTIPTGQMEHPYRTPEVIPTGQLCPGNHQKNRQVEPIGAEAPDETPKPPKKRRSPAPETMDFTPQMIEWAKNHGISRQVAEHQTPVFLDHHRAKGSMFLDWTAAWRTWMTRSLEYKTSGNPRARKPTPEELGIF